MADVVEAASNVGVEDIFVLVLDTAEYGLYRIMTGASWAEPVAVNLSGGVTSSTRLQNRAC